MDNLIDFLLSYDRAGYDTDHSHIIGKCPVCGDPTSSTSRNFSIKVNVEPGEPMLCQCFRADCGYHGYLTVEFIQYYMHCNDLRVILDLSNHNSKLIKKKEKFLKKTKKDVSIVNLNTEINRARLEYLNNRLGLSLVTKDLKKLKIQLDLMDMYKLNDIKEFTMKKGYTQYISDNSIGFLSIFNEYVICRFINKNSSIRYINCSLYPPDMENPNPSKIYVIPSDINQLSPNPIKLRVAEGAITILGVYFNVVCESEIDTIHAANCGSGYYKTISILCKHYGITSIDLEIYSDSEIKMSKYEELYKKIKNEVHVNSMTVFYNTLKEDFGHKKKDIKIYSYRLV